MMLGRRAEPGVVGKYNAESLKQGRKRFNSITKKIHFDHLGIYLCASREQEKIVFEFDSVFIR